MFGIGSFEFLLILLVALVVLGPEHLPKIIRTFNKVTSEFRKVSTDLQRAINTETHLAELENKRKEFEKDLLRPVSGKKETLAAATTAATAEKQDGQNAPAENPEQAVEQAAGSDKKAGTEQMPEPEKDKERV